MVFSDAQRKWAGPTRNSRFATCKHRGPPCDHVTGQWAVASPGHFATASAAPAPLVVEEVVKWMMIGDPTRLLFTLMLSCKIAAILMPTLLRGASQVMGILTIRGIARLLLRPSGNRRSRYVYA
ncbi:unnamed protein product [Miscanthus lutarioriparius]|uniref:Uncharacterized protein n=1 Tax=Miscanthus lutarioriparius TaxID=422564 RepID=A0A811NZD0_9POAL|nr:unnamed protein product [Miscanthus lutarioriparius]